MKNQALKVPFDLGLLNSKLTQIIYDKSLMVYIQDTSISFYEIYPSYTAIVNQETIVAIKKHQKSLITKDVFEYKGIETEIFIFQNQIIGDHTNNVKSRNQSFNPHIILDYIHLYLKNEINAYFLELKDSFDSENIFKLMFLKAHNAMAFATPEGYITYANDSWARMHAYNKAELPGKHLSIFHSKEQLDQEVSIINKNAIEKGIDTREIGHIDSNGNIIPTLMTVIKLENKINEFVGFAGIATDISEQKNLEDRLITILESVAFGIIIIDPETHKIIEINSAAINYINLSKNEIVGKECTNFVCPALKGNCPVKDNYETIINSERVLINGQGEKIPILKTVKTIILGNKKVYIESFIDIRELKQTQRIAEESSRLKTAFLSNISHEIRTPLNHILGFTSIILNDSDISNTYKDYLRIVERSGNNLLKIIEDIVTISKIEAGYSHVSSNEFQLNMMLYSIYTKYQSDLVKMNSGLKFIYNNTIPEKDSYIISDEMKVKQIVDHLISNAIKFTESGFISLSAELKDNTVHISIKDTGIGIAEKDINQIFENFRQAYDKTGKQFGGTGIGLSICKSLSLILGGKIWVESKLGEGSVFHFSFPHKASINDNFINDMKNCRIPDLENFTILVVEDERINYLYIRTILEKTKAKIVWKQNGLEALKYIDNHYDADLILMDMQMPKMDGYEATANIRKTNKEVIIIAQTANALADDRQKCLDLGCNEYTTKPIQQDVLYWHLNHFLIEKRKRSQA